MGLISRVSSRTYRGYCESPVINVLSLIVLVPNTVQQKHCNRIFYTRVRETCQNTKEKTNFHSLLGTTRMGQAFRIKHGDKNTRINIHAYRIATIEMEGRLILQ